MARGCILLFFRYGVRDLNMGAGMGFGGGAGYLYRLKWPIPKFLTRR